MFSNIQNWLIKLIAGKKSIILNAEINGTLDAQIYIQPGKKAFIANSKITKIAL